MSSEVITLLTTINESIRKNDVIIKQIKEYKNRVKLITYAISRSTNDGTLTVKEVVTNKSASQVINEWRCTLELATIPDIFNDKIDYACSTFLDLARLNNEIGKVAPKFQLFGDGIRALEELHKFDVNLNLIREELLKLSDLITYSGSGHLNDIQQELETINVAIRSLRNKHTNLRFT